MACTTYISFFLARIIQLITVAILVSVSSNPLERSQFSFYKGAEWQKGQNILLFRGTGEKNLFSEALYTSNKGMVRKGQMIKVASPSSECSLSVIWLLHVLSLSLGKEHTRADLLSWIKEDRGCWFKLQ